MTIQKKQIIFSILLLLVISALFFYGFVLYENITKNTQTNVDKKQNSQLAITKKKSKSNEAKILKNIKAINLNKKNLQKIQEKIVSLQDKGEKLIKGANKKEAHYNALLNDETKKELNAEILKNQKLYTNFRLSWKELKTKIQKKQTELDTLEKNIQNQENLKSDLDNKQTELDTLKKTIIPKQIKELSLLAEKIGKEQEIVNNFNSLIDFYFKTHWNKKRKKRSDNKIKQIKSSKQELTQEKNKKIIETYHQKNHKNQEHDFEILKHKDGLGPHGWKENKYKKCQEFITAELKKLLAVQSRKKDEISKNQERWDKLDLEKTSLENQKDVDLSFKEQRVIELVKEIKNLNIQQKDMKNKETEWISKQEWEYIRNLSIFFDKQEKNEKENQFLDDQIQNEKEINEFMKASIQEAAKNNFKVQKEAIQKEYDTKMEQITNKKKELQIKQKEVSENISALRKLLDKMNSRTNNLKMIENIENKIKLQENKIKKLELDNPKN